LFASMPALHYDTPRRQLAMYARAMQLFDEAFHDDNPSDSQPKQNHANMR